ncbi:hypothetical protein [Leptospira sarikeiensis]|uniref:Uncharacterized protein n=1 Tax=Leptospira sarikeiensis TaxID=2484943 RepID=A0A4R9K796_9LEPT|nr:hypothetical protein [Leptospira sarikeiensis]TGL61174.1 hypothetical protein EHQ64_11195 [Leptospira sarikeiensis]
METKDVLEITQTINTFYESSWNKLLFFIGIMFTVIGVIIPLVGQWLQRRASNLKTEELRKQIAQETANSQLQILKVFEEKFEELKKDLEKKLLETEVSAESKVNKTLGGLFQLQGNISKEGENHLLACSSYVYAILSYVESTEELNLGRVLRMLPETLKNLQRSDFDQLIELEENIEIMLANLERINENDRYTDSIRSIKQEYLNSKNRTLTN